MIPRHYKCTQFCKGTLDFSLEYIKLLQNDIFKQQFITFNATIPGQDRIYPNTHLCRTFLLGIDIAVISFKCIVLHVRTVGIYIYISKISTGIFA